MASTPGPDVRSGSSAEHIARIEKGWTVYDALGRPVGNVTDVDRASGRLLVDGRAVGFDEFGVPLSAVREAGDNDIHLAQSVAPDAIAGSTPRFVDAPHRGAAPPPAGTEPGGAAGPTAAEAPPTTRPMAAVRGGPAPRWAEERDAGGPGRWLPYLGVVAAGGLGAAGYAWWRRRRKPTYWERAAAFVGDRHPAWWAGLAALLPLAYYARPTRAEPSEPLAVASRWTGAVTGSVPSGGAMVLGPLGAVLAAVGAALWLARRGRGGATRARVADVMTRRPETVGPDATVAQAATMMRSLDVGALPVCDGARLVGMVTDRDIAVRATAEGRAPQATYVRDVMSSGVAWASEDAPVEQAARIMKEHQIRRLPIVDERKHLVGIVSLGDIAVETDDELSGDTLERISETARRSR